MPRFPRCPTHSRSAQASVSSLEGMAAGAARGVLRGLAVAGGGESSDSEDDGWEIGCLDRSSQVVEEAKLTSPSVGFPLTFEGEAHPGGLHPLALRPRTPQCLRNAHVPT
jgi:hypothetical protein